MADRAAHACATASTTASDAPVSDGLVAHASRTGSSRAPGNSDVWGECPPNERTERALCQTGEQFRLAFELSPCGMALITLDGHVLRANRALAHILGYEPQVLEGMRFAELTHPAQRSATISLRPDDVGAAVQLRSEQCYLSADGDVIHTITTVALVRDAGGRPLHCIVQILDQTPQRRAEAERQRIETGMYRVQRLESLGLLAGGVAHDFNNLLLIIVGNAALALLEPPTDAPVRRNLEDIHVAADCAAELTNQLLAYAGGFESTRCRICLSNLVAEMARLLKTVSSMSARLDFELAVGLPAIELNPTQVRQIVMNLVTNASDALGDRGGAITIRTGIATLDTRYRVAADGTRADLSPEATCVYVEVEDDGSGMDADTRDRVFDPCFSTKVEGRGLGLASVRSIVREHSGVMELETAPGRGTRFRILFGVAARSDPTG